MRVVWWLEVVVRVAVGSSRYLAVQGRGAAVFASDCHTIGNMTDIVYTVLYSLQGAL
jgi:hypothetical protein